MEGLMDGRTARWTDIVAMAHRAEAVGFDSIWVNDHFFLQLGAWPPTQSPVSSEDEAKQVGMWECMSVLSALAATTSRVELGTLVIGAGFRNPALLAKMADTIDEISGGRLILGLGTGYHDPEYHAFGYPTDHRYSRFQEAIHIIHSLLRDGNIDFAGTYYWARECELQPRGPRPGGPPIMIGTRGQKMLRLTARYADFWNTSLPAQWRSRLEYLEPEKGLVDVACQEVGRDPSTLGKTGWMVWRPANQPEAIPSWALRLMEPLTGTPEEVATVFREIAQVGVSHLQVAVYPNSLAGIEAFCPVLEALDRGN
jgi:alkanesulfonate monooxygenase SsuD/methylene tetrahydromethanopterin reductase-like flavin-dependent oxidoreductase (luciferase family)